MVTLTMKYSDLFSCMEYIIIWSRFPRREKWLETPKDAVCYASRGEDGEGDGALGVGANKGFRPHWQAGPACNWLYFNTSFHLQEHTDICFWCGFILIDKENYCTCKFTFDASIQCTPLRIGFASTGKTSLATETKVPTESARCALCRNFFFLFSAADEDWHVLSSGVRILKQRNPLDLKSRKSVSLLSIWDLIFDHFRVKADKPRQERPIPSQSITNISLTLGENRDHVKSF